MKGSRKLPSPYCHVRIHSEVSNSEEDLHPVLQAPDLRLPASRTMREILVYGILFEQLEWNKTSSVSETYVPN